VLNRGSSALNPVRRRSRRLTAGLAVAVSAGILLAGCSTEAGVAEDVTVTQTRVNTSAPGTPVIVPEQPTDPTTADPSSADPEPADPASTAPGEATSEDETSPSETSDDPTTPTSSTRTSSTSKTTTPPASDFDPLSLPDDQPADPDAPGPDNGKKCATNDAYVDEKPTGLEPNLILAWRAVEKAANADGVIVCLNDGKRSRAQQQATFDDYVAQYGEEVAKQYVLPPDKSAHVIGNAIDVQPAAAFNWLTKTDGAFGLCRIYDNELWHFEFKKSYAADGCPALLPNPLG